MSELVRHDPCPECPSSDAFAVYDSGWGHCFSCGCNQQTEDQETMTQKTADDPKFLTYDTEDIRSRSIKARVCKLHGYGTTKWKGHTVQVADYRDPEGQLIAQKLKTKTKEFVIIGSGKNLPLWNQHRYSAGGRKLVITEGETDLLCWQSINGKEWPAVSLPNGTGGAVKAIKRQLEYVESFDEVILYFDMDEPGIKAAKEVAELLTPGKCKIAKVPGGANDICEAVAAGLSRDVIDAFWKAQPSRPDGIVGSHDVLQAVLEQKDVDSTSYPWPGMTAMTAGLRMGELVTLTAGTGVGKSQICRAIAWHLIQKGHRVGYVSLEESLSRTGMGLLEQVMGKPIHLGRKDWSDEQLSKIWAENLEGKVCVFNHFGSMDSENLLSKIKFMRIAEGCDFVIVDHLSILVSGWGDGDERRLIDNVMTALRSTVAQTGVGMVLVSHLTKVDSKSQSHEEGGRPRLRDLRGSASIGQLSDIVACAVRNQQDKTNANISELVILKNRFTGQTGTACYLQYEPTTGHLTECREPEKARETQGEGEYGFQ